MEKYTNQSGFTIRNKTFKQQREEQRKGLGPAVHDINPDLFKKKDFSVTEGNIFGRGCRFKQVKETGIPPGTYHKGLLGRSSVEVQQLTKVPPFEWDGMKSRFTVHEPSYKLAPNRYNPVDLKSLETLLNKVTSLRGPFNLLTGPRDETTIKNHFARAKSCAPDVNYAIKSDLDHLLTSKCKSRLGLFRKSKRFPKYPGSRILMADTCYKDPEHPGPADYNPYMSTIAGLHPALTKNGNSGLAPGKYDSDICRCPYKRNMPAGEQWTRKLNMEEYSRYRNYKNLQMLLFKEYEQTLAGPGSHNIPDVTRQFSSVYENTGFTTVERFKSFKDEKLPPGTHSGKFMEGIGKKYLTPVATLEWDGFQKRKIYDEVNFKLSPNRYKYVDPNDTAQIVNKIVSLKGRYNLFTGPRDNSTIKNHFSQGLTKVPDVAYKVENCMDYLINNPVKKRCGKFLKAPRFPKKPCTRLLLNDLSMCYKNPDDPGPANYDLISVKGIKKSTPNKYAFNDSKVASRKPLDWAICPGPGRYFVRYPRCHKKKHHNWVFMTKYPRCPVVKDADPYSIRVHSIK